MGAAAHVRAVGHREEDRAEAGGAGIRTVEELAKADEEMLAARFGPNTGPWLRRLGTGEDESSVSCRAVGAEGSGPRADVPAGHHRPGRDPPGGGGLARQLVEDLTDEGRPVARVVVKVRFAPFFTSTHGVPLPEPSLEADALEAGALAALSKFDLDRPVRLLGVRAELAPPGWRPQL